MRFGEFPGHFPGAPLVPGAALLEAVATQIGLVRVHRVRFLRPVRPGEALDLEVEGDLRVEFRLRRGDEVVLRGVGEVASVFSSS